MNQVLFGHRIGAITSPSLQRIHNEGSLYALKNDPSVRFSATRALAETAGLSGHVYAHQAGCTAISCFSDGRYAASAGADASVRLWDLATEAATSCLLPLASLRRGDTKAHKNSINSISIYPFDPSPSTVFTTSFDKTFLVTQITDTSFIPLHSFPLDYAPFCHAISPIPSPQPLIAVGTAHPATRLLDLRSGYATHSLPGHNGSVYSIAWSPRSEHVLISGATDGRVLFFDVRRANAAFASLDLDDAVGVGGENIKTQAQLLNFGTVAHNGPVTSVQFTPYPASDRVVTAGHDQRIRVWNVSTGRNALVHFGPRIRNERQGGLAPLISPAGFASKPGREVLIWPNDDAKGDLHMYSLHEGQLISTLRTEGVRRGDEPKGSEKMIGKGRINQIVWRQGEACDGLEMLSAHGDGTIGVWRAHDREDGNSPVDGQEASGSGMPVGPGGTVSKEIEEAENKRKRKREMLEGLVEGLTKKSVH
jgi:DNA excision repair protein ERCC-8